MKISVITVCLNSSKTIEKTIISVINQNYKNIEYIIIDGGSKDNTNEIVKKYKNNISKFISENDNGIYSAINKGIKLATGEIVSILHSDDYYFNSEVLSEVVDYFKVNKHLECLIGTTLMKRKSSDNILRKYSPINFKKWMFYFGISPPHPSLFLKNSLYQKFGLYEEKYKIAADFEFYLRLFLINKINYKFTKSKYVVMNYGGKSTFSLKSNLVSSKEILSSFKDNKLYNNWFLILLRFPVKLLQFVFKK